MLLRDSDSLLKFHRRLFMLVLAVSCLSSPPLQQTVLCEMKSSNCLFVILLIICRPNDAQTGFYLLLMKQ